MDSLNLLWIIPLSVVGLIGVLVYTYVVWSVPIWGADAIKNMLETLGSKGAKPDEDSSTDGHVDSPR
jgi:hypothetical protein